MDFTEERSVSCGNVFYQFGSVGIYLSRVFCISAAEQLGEELCRGRNGLLGLYAILFKLLDKKKVLNERVVVACYLAGQLYGTMCCLLTMKLIAMV